MTDDWWLMTDDWGPMTDDNSVQSLDKDSTPLGALNEPQ